MCGCEFLCAHAQCNVCCHYSAQTTPYNGKRDGPSHLLLCYLTPVYPVGSMTTEREGRKEERGAVCLLLTLSLWEPKMGSVSRTPTCCQEENVRTSRRDEKKESKASGITTSLLFIWNTLYITYYMKHSQKIWASLQHMKTFSPRRVSLPTAEPLQYLPVRCISKTPSNVSTAENNSLNWFFFSVSNSK